MELFWEQCRGEPFVMLYETVQKFLKKLKWRLPAIPIDDHEDIDFEKIVSHLKSHPLNDQFTIAAWYSYMYKTVYMEIEDKVVYKAYGTILIDDEILDDHEPIESILVTKDLILAARKALKERAEDARPGSKAHEIYQRQYEVFHILSEGGTIEAISKAFGVRQKTILRDISEIKIFLEKSLPEISIY
jgi:hypothetical protein